MDLFMLINELRKSGVNIYKDGDNLRVKSAKGKVDAALLTQVSNHKEALLRLLSKTGDNGSGIENSAAADDYPLTYQQRSIWMLSQDEAASVAYNIPLIIRFNRQLNISALRQAIQDIVDRHEVFRTSFFQHADGEIRQRQGAAAICIHETDISALTESEIEQLLYWRSMTPVPLDRPPLMHVSLLRKNERSAYLLIVVHHIIFDGRSLEILENELSAAYEARSRDEAPVFQPIPLTYKDFAVWEYRRAGSDHWSRELAFWKKQLAGDLPVLDIAPGSRPPVKTYAGRHSVYELPASLHSSLRDFCQAEKVSFFSGLLAVLNALFYKYTGNRDLLLGTIDAGRHHPELQALIGLFIQTVPLRTRLSGGEGFIELIQAQFSVLEEALAHSQLPFGYLVEQLGNKRDISRSAIFDILVIYNEEERPVESIFRRGEQTAPVQYDLRSTSQFDITYTFNVRPDRTLVGIEYNTDIYNAAFIDRLFGHYTALMGSLLSQPSLALSRQQYLSAGEQQQLLAVFNQAGTVRSAGLTLLDLFNKQVAGNGDFAVLYYKDQSFSYRQIDDLSGRLSCYLINNYGVSLEDRVGVCLKRSEWLIISLVAVLKAGAAYVPVDPSYPPERINYITQDSGCRVCIDDKMLQQFIAVKDDYSQDGANRQIHEHHLAYVIYTSGSSGRPKGCMLEHKGVVNRIQWLWQEYDFTSEDVVMQKTNFTFDVSVGEIFMPLCFGCKMVLCEEEDIYTPDKLLELISRHQATYIHFVPGMFDAFIGEAFATEQKTGCLHSLRRVFTSGEALSAKTLNNWYSRSAIPVSNLYGPTEAAIEVSFFNTTPGISSVPIGKPITNTFLYILDQDLQLMPVGISGELYIGGIQLARGYLNQDGLTQEKFIANPFRPGEKIYRTGDKARWREDGNIEFLGRLDEQVKIRGYRIELEEIEHTLQQAPGVEQAAVTVYEDSSGNRNLAACIVAAPSFDKEQVIGYLKKQLPAYMVPARWLQLPVLPVNASGKLNRKALLTIGNFAPEAKVITAPRNQTEEKLLKIWQQLLGLSEIDIHDNFFELGGHSLLAIRLISFIRKEFNVAASLETIFNHHTIADLAAYLLVTGTDQEGLPVIGIQERPVRLPLSYAQERLWFIDRLHGTIAYHIPVLLALKGRLDVNSLSSAFRDIIRRHEALRTVIREEDDQSWQYVLDPGEWQMGFVDDEKYRNNPAACKAYIARQTEQAFDLSSDYMIRADLLRLGEEEHLLVITLHHISFDGWSFSVLTRELAGLYARYAGGEQLAPVPPALQYADYAIWQRKYLSGSLLEEKLRYWQEKLHGLAPLELPTDFPRPAIQSTRGDSISLTVNTATYQQLVKLAQQQDSTLFIILLSVFKVLLFRYSGQEDICVGVPVANRQQRELEAVIGYFVNSLPLRSDLSGNPAFTALMAQVKATLLDAYAFQEAPLEKIVEAVVTGRHLNRTPLFQVLFTMDTASAFQLPALGEVELLPLELGSNTSQFDISIAVAVHPEKLELKAEYCTDLFTAHTVSKMLSHFEQLLQAVAVEPWQQIESLEMLAAGEREEIIETFNHTIHHHSPGATIIDLLKVQAQRTPSATALIFDEQRLTFEELHLRSNQLAHYLKKKGVGPETLVPVCLNRSPDLIIGVLGILKAGGAYVPVDPQYPGERIAYMLNDTEAQIAVSNAACSALLQGRPELVVIDLDNDRKAIAQEPVAEPESGVRMEDLAYVIYTSGSTGRPKGVMIAHRNLFSFICWCHEEFSPDDFELVYAVTSVCFDLSVFEIFYPLTAGKPLRIIENGLYIGKYLSADKAVLLNTVPSTVRMLLQEGMPVENIAVLNMAGETIPGIVLQLLDVGRMQVRNLYGPSETTTYSTVYRLEKGKPSLIGKPVHNTNIYIVNNASRLNPPGVTGEVWIGGAGVARGYLHHSALTAERFIADPFRPGQRLYRTGDLARWQPDGNIEYIGRKDHQVKIRGYRIEPEEISHAIEESGLVQQALVLAVKEENGDGRLIAYYIADPDTDIFPQLRNYLQQRLPAYMIPAAGVSLRHWPLTPNGKIDRHALPLPGAQLSRQVYSAPRNTTEQLLTEICNELLQLEDFGIFDNFFDRGGSSLKAISLVNRIHKRIGVKLQIRDIFMHPDMASLAGVISVAGSTAYDRIEQVSEQSSYALSPAQQRLWLLYRINSNSTAFNLSGTFDAGPSPDLAALKKALRALVDRHESLRTIFVEVDGEARQQVLNVADLDIDTAFNIDPAFNSTKLFRLDSWPLFSLFLDSDSWRLEFCMHHIIADGWSMDIFAREFRGLYAAAQQGERLDLPPLPVQYKDYAHWQQQQYASREGDPARHYWQQQLGSQLPVQRLPIDYEHYYGNEDHGASVYTCYIGQELKGGIESYLRSCRQSPAAFLTACTQLLLARLLCSGDILTGMPVANRERADIKDVVGFFLNTILLRTEVDRSLSFERFLIKLGDQLLSALEHQHFPIEWVLEEIDIPIRSMDLAAIIPVFINVQDFEHTRQHKVTSLESSHGRSVQEAKFDLECYFTVYHNAIGLTAVYRNSLFKPQSIQLWMDALTGVMAQAIASPGASLKELLPFGPQFSLPAGMQEVAIGAIESADLFPAAVAGQSLVSVFEAVAVRHGSRIAVADGAQQLSYAALNMAANRVAWAIADMHGRPGELAALLFPHGHLAISAIMGVLKAGLAYVPLDPHLPALRLSFILNDTGSDIILCCNETLDQAMELAAGKRAVINIEELASDSCDNPGLALSGQELAYILYTSGSTGEPKGVMQSHRNVLHFMRVYTNNLHITAQDRISLLPTYTFDSGVMDIFGALLNGSCLAIYNLRKDGTGPLADWIDAEGITILHTVPTLYRLFTQGLGERRLSAVRLVVLGGEAVFRKDFESFKRHYAPGAVMINGYGPTESTITLQYHMRHDTALDRLNVPIGYAVSDTTVYLLNEEDDPVGLYEPGELVYSSGFLAWGYWNKPALTNKVFTIDPVKGTGRVYRSGDLARRLPGGFIEFLGRKDTQVKIRGQRVELSEIEHLISREPGVGEAVVVLGSGDLSDKLLAYIRPDKAGFTDGSGLRVRLRQQLPFYMVPDIYVVMEDLPLTNTGKIDRRRLPVPDLKDRQLQQAPYAPPRNAIEEKLQSIWMDIIKTEQPIGIQDNFLDIGGDSIKAIRILSTVAREFGITLSLRRMFDVPTIENLANEIQNLIWQRVDLTAEGHEMIEI